MAPVLDSASPSCPSFPGALPAESSGALCMPALLRVLQGRPQSEPRFCKECALGRAQILPAQVLAQPGCNSGPQALRPGWVVWAGSWLPYSLVGLQLPAPGPDGFLEGTSRDRTTLGHSDAAQVPTIFPFLFL